MEIKEVFATYDIDLAGHIAMKMDYNRIRKPGYGKRI